MRGVNVFFFAVGILVVATLVTLPYVGWFFAAALAGGALTAGAMLFRHMHRRP